MRHRYSELFLPFQLVVDTLLLNIAFYASYLVRFREINLFEHSAYITLGLVFNLAWFFLLLILRPYHYSRVTFNANNLLIKLTEITFLHACIIALFWITVQGYYYSRGQLLMAYCFFFPLGIIWRFGALVFLKLYRASGYNTRKYIIVGYGDLSQAVTAFYENHPEMGYQFQGYFGEEVNTSRVGIRGSYEQLESFIQTNSIDFIYCCLPYIKNDKLKSIIELAERNDAQVNLVMDFRGFLTNKASIEYHDYLPVIQLSTKPFSNVQKEVAKRIFDLTFASLTLLIGAPVFLLIALLVKCTSPGPVLFIQERSGRWGKPFKIYKFRSMYKNAHELAQQHSKGDDDPRITQIGRFLRKTRLDEIPQFYNVIRGDMSIVGPRPLVRYDVDMLMTAAPNDFRKILTVRPGITSIGQIEVGYADNPTTSVKRLQYDLAYLEKSNLQTDLWLIAQTVRVMMQGKGK